MGLTLKDLQEDIKELKELMILDRQTFNARQAANYLSISYDTMLRLARIGDVDYVKNGTNYIFRRKHLDEWLDRKERRRRG